MEKEWFEKPWIIAFPIVIFLAFAIWYSSSQTFFVECETRLGVSAAGCFRADITNLYRTELLTLDGNPVTTEPQTDAGIRKTLSKRYSGRFVWMFAIGINALCALGAWVIALFTINKWIGDAETGAKAKARKFVDKLGRQKWVVIFAIVSIVISLLVVLLEGENIAPIYKNTIQPKANGGIESIEGVMNTVHVLTFMGVFSLIAAMCVIAFPRKEERVTGAEDAEGVKKGPGFEKEALDVLLEKKNWLSFLLYTATVLLVVSVARMHATLSWTTFFMTTDTVDGAREFFAQFTTILGGFYTLMLAAIYLPVAYIVFERGRSAQEAVLNKAKGAKRNKKEEAPDEKTAPETGFKFSFAEAFPKFLAILAPFLAGPIAELLKYIATG